MNIDRLTQLPVRQYKALVQRRGLWAWILRKLNIKAGWELYYYVAHEPDGTLKEFGGNK